MSEAREPQPYTLRAGTTQPLIAVPVGDQEVCYFTSDDELDATLGAEAIQQGLDLAGAWSDLGISEDEMLEALERIRHEAAPTPPIDSL